jgi:hypothetical protein
MPCLNFRCREDIEILRERRISSRPPQRDSNPRFQAVSRDSNGPGGASPEEFELPRMWIQIGSSTQPGHKVVDNAGRVVHHSFINRNLAWTVRIASQALRE